MSTIVTRSGKGSPLTHAEVDSNFTNLNTDKLELSGGTMTGDVGHGDNVKATFGASNDLQIYHDGSSSYIADNGNGNLVLTSNGVRVGIYDAANNQQMAQFDTGDAVRLYHNGAEKLETTSSGIDVTGTVVSDGAQIDVADGYGVNVAGGSGSVSEASYYWAQGQRASFGYDGSAVSISDINQSGSTASKSLRVSLGGADRLFINHSSGDISFYEDTGTTAKFFWDASAESLGIGTSSPSRSLHISGGTNSMVIERTDATTSALLLVAESNTTAIYSRASNASTTARDLAFNMGSTEAMRIDSSGNVGIGTSSPQQLLHVYGNSPIIYLETSDSRGQAWQIRSTNGATAASGTLSFRDEAGNTWLDFANNGGSNQTKFFTGGSERMRIDSSGNVGIGTSSPQAPMHIDGGSSSNILQLSNTAVGSTGSDGVVLGMSASDVYFFNRENTAFRFGTNNLERMRIDSSGNLLVGKTSADFGATAGMEMQSNNTLYVARSGGSPLTLNRLSSDGDIALFRKDDTTVGSIGTNNSGDLYIGNDDTTLLFAGGSDAILPRGTEGAVRDAAISFGVATNRFKDLYLSGGVYLGGTGSANLLDDYEVGYHQTTIQMGSGSATAGASNDLLRYTIIGNMCFITGNIGITSVSSPSGTMSFTVPFAIDTSLSETSERAAGTIHLNGFSSENGSGVAFFETGSSVFVKTYARNDPVPTGACEFHVNIFYPIA